MLMLLVVVHSHILEKESRIESEPMPAVRAIHLNIYPMIERPLLMSIEHAFKWGQQAIDDTFKLKPQTCCLILVVR